VLTTADKATASMAVLQGVALTWYRLVFKYQEQTSLQIFSIAAAGADVSAEHVTQHATSFEEKGISCIECVDHYTKVWTARLKRKETQQRAVKSLRLQLAIMRVTGSSCERKHLLGQETHHTKKRGRALTCAGLGKVAYLRGVREAAGRKRRRILTAVLGSAKLAVKTFSQGLHRFQVRGATSCKRKRKKVTTQDLAPDSKRAKRGFDIYVSRNFDREGAGTVVQKRQQLNKSWSDLPHDRKRLYVALANGENCEGAELDAAPEHALEGAPHPDALEPQAASSDERGAGVNALDFKGPAGRQRLLATLKAMRSHPSLLAGTQTCSFESGLKVENVLDAPNAAMTAHTTRTFKYNDHISENPTGEGAMRLPQVCALRCGGLCVGDPGHEACRVGTKNIYHTFRRQLGKDFRKKLPLLTQFTIQATETTHSASDFAFCTTVRGAGELVLFVRAEELYLPPRRDDVQERRFTVSSEPTVATTSQLLFRRLFREASRPGQDAAYITSNEMRFDAFKIVPADDSFQFEAIVAMHLFDTALNIKHETPVRLAAVPPPEAEKPKFMFGIPTEPGASDDDADYKSVSASSSDSDPNPDIVDEDDVLKKRAAEALSSESDSGTDDDTEKKKTPDDPDEIPPRSPVREPPDDPPDDELEDTIYFVGTTRDLKLLLS